MLNEHRAGLDTEFGPTLARLRITRSTESHEFPWPVVGERGYTSPMTDSSTTTNQQSIPTLSTDRYTIPALGFTCHADERRGRGDQCPHQIRRP
ncbi:MAG: hypothetical protein DI525_05090 [Corynebacterium kroppenstedtii]|uniref:Uncharacterized protein n=1 Tax=Corynebacterium kroppenstedtii TaxID=161879 RepID=A0A2W5SQQ8_9CORY|nr:MAG: hypothetical protein DI525_05090 [Corynebacterium kroppenstedtii]